MSGKLLKLALILGLAATLLLAGCARGTPKAATPETEHDFGNVPVTNNMNDVRVKQFVIKNEGTADLKLSDVQVKLLQGC